MWISHCLLAQLRLRYRLRLRFSRLHAFQESTIATGAKLYNPFSAYYDKSTGDIYIADTVNHRIRRVRGGIISTVAGKTCTDSDDLGDGVQATDACLKNPYQFTVNDEGE